MLHEIKAQYLLLATIIGLILSAPAGADPSLATPNLGLTSRGILTHDAQRNTTGASFGNPTDADHRMFSLRWRMPLVAMTGLTGQNAYAQSFAATPLSTAGLGFAFEPFIGLSPVIPQFRLWEPGKALHVQAGVISNSIGHQTIVSNFTNTPEGTVRLPGVHIEGNLAGIGAEFSIANLLQPGDFFGGRVYGRPIMWFLAPDAAFLQPNELDIDPRTETLGMWVTGLSVAADANAPGVEGVVAAGWDNELALLDNQLIKLIGFVDGNVLTGTQNGTGVGVHSGARFEVSVPTFRLELNAEYNVAGENYVPRYFDRVYMIERTKVLGGPQAKAELSAPGSHGYALKASTGFFDWLTVFLEARDQFAFDSNSYSSNGQFTLGASAWFAFAGAHVTLTRTGLDYANIDAFGPGFIAMGEARVALLANIFHVVTKGWAIHQPYGDGKSEWESGMLTGLEVNFDIL